MTFDLSEKWEETDKSVYLVHNFTDTRVKMDVKVDGKILFENNTIPSSPSEYSVG